MDLRRLFAHKALENQKTLPVTPKGEPWVPGACWRCALPVTQKRLTYTYVSVHSLMAGATQLAHSVSKVRKRKAPDLILPSSIR